MPSVAQPFRAASGLALVAAVVWVGVIAWLSQGLMAFTHAGGDRIVMLPLSFRAAILVVLAAAGVALLARAGTSLVPLLLLGFLVLPWIPGRVPPAFLLWLGPLTLLMWAAVALTMARSALGRRGEWRLRLENHPTLTAGAIAFVIYSLAAWQVSPSIPGGDEPHYLVITQSLLKDGDLRIENNHRRGDYQVYHPGPLQPDFRRRGRDGEIYSIHAPGVSALVAPAFAVGGYPAAVVFLILVAAAGSALTWRLAWIATARTDAAWFGWAAVTLAATSIFHSFTVYPDGPGGVLVLTGVWALLRAEQERDTGTTRVRPWLLHGAALAALPWLHTRFALFAGTLGALILLRLAATRNAAAKAAGFLIVPAVSAVCWMAYFVAIYGTPDPSAPYAGEAGSLAFVPGGLAGLLFDQRFGLLAYAPVLVAAIIGFGVMIGTRTRVRLALEMLFVLAPYLLTVTHFAMWWGGWSAPARFAAPMLPVLAIPAAICWAATRDDVGRATALAALAFTAFASAVLVVVDGGRLAYNSVREPAALWLPRANGVVDIAGGLPLWSRTTDYPLFRDTAIWLVVLGAAWAILRWGIGPRTVASDRHRGLIPTLAVGCYAIAAMIALTLVWHARGSSPVAAAAAQLEMLRHISRSPSVFALDYGSWRPVSRDNVPGRLRIELSRELPPRRGANELSGGAARDDRPLFAIPAVPAGEYRVTPVVTAPRGWVMLGASRDQFALQTEPLAAAVAGLELRAGVNLRELVLRGDDEARQVVRALRLEPLSLLPRNMRPTDAFARRAVRYGTTTAFFLDDRSFPEPEAFWVGGARSSSLALQPEERRDALDLFVRNAPVENRLRLEVGDWEADLQLAPGEERRVRVPLDGSRDAALVHVSSAAGFRPSAVDPTSRDDRYLGVWIQLK